MLYQQHRLLASIWDRQFKNECHRGNECQDQLGYDIIRLNLDGHAWLSAAPITAPPSLSPGLPRPPRCEYEEKTYKKQAEVGSCRRYAEDEGACLLFRLLVREPRVWLEKRQKNSEAEWSDAGQGPLQGHGATNHYHASFLWFFFVVFLRPFFFPRPKEPVVWFAHFFLSLLPPSLALDSPVRLRIYYRHNPQNKSVGNLSWVPIISWPTGHTGHGFVVRVYVSAKYPLYLKLKYVRTNRIRKLCQDGQRSWATNPSPASLSVFPHVLGERGGE